MIRRYLLPVILSLVIFCSAVFLFFNNNYFFSLYLKRFIEQRFDYIRLLSLMSGEQYYQYPDMLVLRDLVARFQYQKEVYQIEADEIILHDVFHFWKNKEDLRVTTTGFSIFFPKMAWRSFDMNLNLKFQKNVFSDIQGIFRKMRLEAAPHVIDDISGKIHIDQKFIEIVELSGFWDISPCQGQVKIGRNPKADYTMYLEFFNINPERLQKTDPLFANVRGLVDGTLRIAGTKYDVDQFVLDLRSHQAGAIKPGLLRMLNPFVSDQATNKRIAQLIADNKELEFDQSALLIQDFRDYRGQVMVNIINRGENLSCMERISVKGRVNWLEIFGF